MAEGEEEVGNEEKILGEVVDVEIEILGLGHHRLPGHDPAPDQILPILQDLPADEIKNAGAG